MSTAAEEDLRSYVFAKTDDPDILARRRMIIDRGLEASPEIREDLVGEAREEARVEEARVSLRHVLALRRLAMSPQDEAQVEACTELGTLRRWLDQAIVAASTSEALR